MEFKEWPKIPRWSKDIIITEKIDGTNACVVVEELDPLLAGNVYYTNNICALVTCRDKHFAVGAQSRSRSITPSDDNFGFAAYVQEHADELVSFLGPGYHYGEWWGKGIQRGYGQDAKHFSLFNATRWASLRQHPDLPFSVVPVLYEGPNVGTMITHVLVNLELDGSCLVKGYMNPEGIIIYHTASGSMYKKLIENDATPKSLT